MNLVSTSLMKYQKETTKQKLNIFSCLKIVYIVAFKLFVLVKTINSLIK